MAWEATDETVATGGGGPGGWTEEQPTSWWDRAKGVGQTVDDAVRAAANAATFGMADRLAGLTEGGTDAAVKRSEAARERSPIASIGGTVAGSVALPGLGGARLAALGGNTLRARATGYGLEGAGHRRSAGRWHHLYRQCTGLHQQRHHGRRLRIWRGSARRRGIRATAERIKCAGADAREQGRGTDVAYRTLRANPAAYDAGQFGQAANRLERRLLDEGYVQNYSPGSFTAVERMRAAQADPNAVVTPANIDLIRKGINRIPRTPEAKTDRESGQMVKNALDEFLTNPPPGSIRPGTEAAATTAAHQAGTARNMAATEFRMQKLADMREAAENQAASAWSGLNVENNIRQQVKNFINPNTGGRQRLAGYNPEERAALRNIVHRGGVANVGRWTGNVLAGGGGVAVPVAMMAGNEFVKQNPELSAAVPAAGLGMRMLSNRSARGAIGRAENLIAQRSPLYAQRAANAPMVRGGGLSPGTTQTLRDAMTIELLNQQRRRREDD